MTVDIFLHPFTVGRQFHIGQSSLLIAVGTVSGDDHNPVIVDHFAGSSDGFSPVFNHSNRLVRIDVLHDLRNIIPTPKTPEQAMHNTETIANIEKKVFGKVIKENVASVLGCGTVSPTSS